MNFLIKMEKQKPNQPERIKPQEAKKGDKIFLVRRQKVFYVGKILK